MISVYSNGTETCGYIIKDKNGNPLPAMRILDTIFVFDLSDGVLDGIKHIYEEAKIPYYGTNIFQLDTSIDMEVYKRNLKEFINYAIFYYQDLCERLNVISIDKDFTNESNEVWPPLVRKITKLNKREWPKDTFVFDFASSHSELKGSCAVSPGPDLLDMNDLISCIIDLTPSESDTTVTESVTPYTKNGKLVVDIDKVPDEIKNQIIKSGKYKTELPETVYAKEDDATSTYTYSYIYYYHNEITEFPIIEMHSKIANGLSATKEYTRNTIVVHAKRLVKIEIHEEVTVVESGGGE